VSPRERWGSPPDPDSGEGRSGGGIAAFFGRLVESPDNPLGWSVRIFTAWGIAVRLHLATILFVVFMLLSSIAPNHAGFVFMSMSMACLLGLVLVHEFGHCFACRFVGGTADRIVMLPFGGLALVRPPDDWRSSFITTAGGPAVHLFILPFTSLALFASGLGHTIVFNPLDPLATLSDPAFTASTAIGGYARVGLWWLHFNNIILFCFNVFLPAYPLDGGRLVQALLWRKVGYKRATDLAVTIGFVGAMALGVFGLVFDQTMLIMIAVFAAWSCWMERRRLRSADELGDAVAPLGSGLSATIDDDAALEAKERERQAKERAAREAQQAELDRILEKISRVGMDGLSRAERKILQAETERRRKVSP
jgi:stage IV sporulation protein FB